VVLGLDQNLNAARDARGPPDEAGAFEGGLPDLATEWNGGRQGVTIRHRNGPDGSHRLGP
jgi:hypothetical protein